MKRKQEKGTKKIRRKPPVFEFGGEVTLVRLALTEVSFLCLCLTQGIARRSLPVHVTLLPYDYVFLNKVVSNMVYV